MILAPKLCPCGCSKVILEPLCGCQCSSVRPEAARDVAVRVNMHDELVGALKLILENPNEERFRNMARGILASIDKDLKATPKFEKYPWAQ